MHSFWRDTKGRYAVSVNEHQPGPVAGYLIEGHSGWTIEGDEDLKVYSTKGEAAKILVDRFHSARLRSTHL